MVVRQDGGLYLQGSERVWVEVVSSLTTSRCCLVFAGNAWVLYGQASRAISTGKLNASPRLHIPPINLVVFKGPSGSSKLQGDLILKGASRLDAFSGYPVRT